jgi:hypothetical protein
MARRAITTIEKRDMVMRDMVMRDMMKRDWVERAAKVTIEACRA